MNISNATYMPVYMRWDTFTFPIKPGTPVSSSGAYADNAAAVGLVAQTIKEKPLFASLLVLIGGEVEGSSMEYTISDEAKDALNGIRIFTKGKADEPSPYTLPKASATKLGGVKIGENVNVDTNGKISVAFPDATTSAKGMVKMAANVAAAAGEAPTKAEFDALIAALIAAGLMAAAEE